MPIIPHLRGCRKCTASSRLAWTLEWAPIKKKWNKVYLKLFPTGQPAGPVLLVR